MILWRFLFCLLKFRTISIVFLYYFSLFYLFSFKRMLFPSFFFSKLQAKFSDNSCFLLLAVSFWLSLLQLPVVSPMYVWFDIGSRGATFHRHSLMSSENLTRVTFNLKWFNLYLIGFSKFYICYRSCYFLSILRHFSQFPSKNSFKIGSE